MLRIWNQCTRFAFRFLAYVINLLASYPLAFIILINLVFIISAINLILAIPGFTVPQ